MQLSWQEMTYSGRFSVSCSVIRECARGEVLKVQALDICGSEVRYRDNEVSWPVASANDTALIDPNGIRIDVHVVSSLI